MDMTSKTKSRLIGGAAAALVLALDQVTKYVALSALTAAGGRIRLSWPVDLTLVFNRSNSFGLVPVFGDVTRWGLAAFGIGIAAVVIWILWRSPHSKLVAAGLGCIAAAGLGNALDRLNVGAVIDFIDASKIGFPWVFNAADASLDVGIALLALGYFLEHRATKTPDSEVDGRT
jgi:signal peptidase II